MRQSSLNIGTRVKDEKTASLYFKERNCKSGLCSNAFGLKTKAHAKNILKLLLFLLLISLVVASYVNTLGGNQLLLDISGLTQTTAGTSIPISDCFPPERRDLQDLHLS